MVAASSAPPAASAGVAVQLAAQAGATVVAPALPEDERYLRDLGVTRGARPRDGDVAADVRERCRDGVDALLDLVTLRARSASTRALERTARASPP